MGPEGIGALACPKVPAMAAHVVSALAAGKMPKATKPYPHAAMWAMANGCPSMVPAILAACDKVAGHIGNSDGYSDDLAAVKGNLSKMMPAPKVAEPKVLPEPVKALVVVPPIKTLIPDAINPPEVLVIPGGRWIDVTPEELVEIRNEYDARKAKEAADKAAIAAKIAAAQAAHAASPKPEPKPAPKPDRWNLIELE
jgi:hypothetical protein